MDKYLESRASLEETGSSGRSQRRLKKKSKRDEKERRSLKEILKSFLDVDEVIDKGESADDEELYDAKTLKEKLADAIRKKKESEGNLSDDKSDYVDPEAIKSDLSKNGVDVGKKSSPVNNDDVKIEEVQEYDDSSSTTTTADVFDDNLDKGYDDTSDQSFYSQSAKDMRKRALQSSSPKNKSERNLGSESERHDSAWKEYRSDLREVVTITYKIMKKVPPEAIREFKESDDFKRYVKILEKYELLRKKPKETQ